MELLKLTSFSSLLPNPTSPPKPSLPAAAASSLALRPRCRSTATVTMSMPQTAESARAAAMEDVMGSLLRERIVFLGTDIDDEVADVIASHLLLLDFQDPSADIRLFLNTRGGSFNASMAIYDVMQLVRADVSTIALGTTEGTASLILGGGTKGKRFSMPSSRIMITQPIGCIEGCTWDAENQARELMNLKKITVSLISGFTGRTEERVEKDIDNDLYMSSIEAVKYGIIDGVIDRERILPVVPLPRKIRATRALEFEKDPIKFLNPDVPDDEIF